MNWWKIIKGLSKLSQAASNMPKFRDKQDLLYLSHFDDNIEDEEFMRTGEIKKNKIYFTGYTNVLIWKNFHMMSA